MADKKIYKVIDGPIGIRGEPDGPRSSAQLAHGEEVEVLGDPVEKNGMIWVKHAKGWSAVGNKDGDEVLMLDISNRPADAPRIYRIWAQTASVRDAPNGKRLSLRLMRKMEIKVDPTSRTEAGGYIWWKHDKGWSAERSVDGRETLMKEVFDTPAALGAAINPAKRVELPATWKGKISLQVATPTKVRNQPSTDPRGFIIITMKPGKSVEVDMDTLVEADGYFWVRHDLGWSAIQSIDGKTRFLAEPGSIPGMIYIGPDGPKLTDLPGLKILVSRLPVTLGDIGWFQYYGNNMFAYMNGKKYGYDRYSQGLHGGLDFGNSQKAGVKVYAGIEGEYVKSEYPSPNNARVLVRSGNYVFIYQHITNIRPFSPGQKVTPDTIVGEIEHHSINNGWDHLHFEVRYMTEWIINPLLLMTDAVYNQIAERFKPDKVNSDYTKTESRLNFFYISPKWTKWSTPLDQPCIRLNGQCVGPRFEEMKPEEAT
jgi:murein DD-endopeptidase MepM/ murein hydrolase activator NlpD